MNSDAMRNLPDATALVTRGAVMLNNKPLNAGNGPAHRR